MLALAKRMSEIRTIKWSVHDVAGATQIGKPTFTEPSPSNNLAF